MPEADEQDGCRSGLLVCGSLPTTNGVGLPMMPAMMTMLGSSFSPLKKST